MRTTTGTPDFRGNNSISPESLLATKPLTKEPEDSGYEIGAYIVVTFQPSSQSFSALSNLDTTMRVSQGFWGTREHWENIEGNKGTLANFWEQGNQIRKITIRKHSENVCEHGNLGQFWKGTREQGPPPPPLGDPLL